MWNCHTQFYSWWRNFCSFVHGSRSSSDDCINLLLRAVGNIVSAVVQEICSMKWVLRVKVRWSRQSRKFVAVFADELCLQTLHDTYISSVIWLTEVWCCLCWLTVKLSAWDVQHYLFFFVKCLVMVSLKSLLFK